MRSKRRFSEISTFPIELMSYSVYTKKTFPQVKFQSNAKGFLLRAVYSPPKQKDFFLCSFISVDREDKIFFSDNFEITNCLSNLYEFDYFSSTVFLHILI